MYRSSADTTGGTGRVETELWGYYLIEGRKGPRKAEKAEEVGEVNVLRAGLGVELTEGGEGAQSYDMELWGYDSLQGR